MLGAQGTDEDLEATEMLVGNAQNLMQSVLCTAVRTPYFAEFGEVLRQVHEKSHLLFW